MTRRNKTLSNDVINNTLATGHVTRRDALRSVTTTVAFGAATVASLNTSVAAFDDYSNTRSLPTVDKSHWVSGHEGIVVFVDDWEGVSAQHMRAVSFLNTSENPITLNQVNPGLLRAEQQVFNLNHILAKGPVTVMPNETRSFGLYPVSVDNLETLVPGQADSVSTLVRCTPHSMVVDGSRKMTQYAVIA